MLTPRFGVASTHKLHQGPIVLYLDTIQIDAVVVRKCRKRTVQQTGSLVGTLRALRPMDGFGGNLMEMLYRKSWC